MKITTIKQLESFLDRSYRLEYKEYYRGQPCDTYKLLPQLCRSSWDLEQLTEIEKQLLNEFKLLVETEDVGFQEIPFVNKHEHGYSWTLLFQGQELGLKTRLLDWTTDWKMALFFALDSNECENDDDAQFWVFKCPRKHIVNDEQKEKILQQNLFQIDDLYLINFPGYMENSNQDYVPERRRRRQLGIFSIQPLDSAVIPMEDQRLIKPCLKKFIIDKTKKESIKAEILYTKDWVCHRRDEAVNEKIKKINKLLDQ